MGSNQWAICTRGIHHWSPTHLNVSGCIVTPVWQSCFIFLLWEGLLEIKSPYSIGEQDPTTVPGGDFYLKFIDSCLQLSKKHSYFYQIQGQFAVCNCYYCDFVYWTPHGERIAWGESAWYQMQPRLQAFFVDVLLPKILSPPISAPALSDSPLSVLL